MKKLFIVALALNFSILGAQDIESSNDVVYSFSEPFDAISTYQGYPMGYKTSFVIDGEINSFQLNGGTYKFLKYSDPFLNETLRNEVPKDESLDIEGVERIADRYYYFYSKWDRPKKSEQLFVRELDFEKGDFAGPERKLYASVGKLNAVDLPLAMMMAFPKFNRVKSRDANSLLVTYTWNLKPKVMKRSNLQIGMHLYDQNIAEVWQRVVEIPHLANNVSIMGYALGQNKNAYLLVQIFKDKSEERKDKSGSYLKVFCVNGQTGNVTDTDISMDGLIVAEAMLSENEEGQIVVCGLYGKSSPELFHGVFATRLNENGEFISTQTNDIPVSVIAQHSKPNIQAKIARTAETANWGLKHLVLRNVSFGNDGSITLFAEELSVGNYTELSAKMNHTPTGGQGMSTTDKSNIRYGDVLVAYIAPDSALSQFNVIPKRQLASVRGDYSRNLLKRTTFFDLGFALIDGHDSDYIIFIDNVKNFNLPEDEFPEPHRFGLGGFLTGYKIDPRADEKENIVFFDLKDAQGWILKNFSVAKVIQLSEKEMAIEFATEVAKKNVMVKVTLPE